MGAFSTFFSLLATGLCNRLGLGLEGACLTVTGNGAADKEPAWAPWHQALPAPQTPQGEKILNVWDNGPGKQKLIVAFCCCPSTTQNPEQEYTQNTVHGDMFKNVSEPLPSALTPTCLTSPCSCKFLPYIKMATKSIKEKNLKCNNLVRSCKYIGSKLVTMCPLQPSLLLLSSQDSKLSWNDTQLLL